MDLLNIIFNLIDLWFGWYNLCNIVEGVSNDLIFFNVFEEFVNVFFFD